MSTIETTLPDVYLNAIKHIHDDLGIVWEQVLEMGLSLQPEASHLVSIGLDDKGRTQYLTPKAAMAWEQMRQQAQKESIVLLPVSGFRSVVYQTFIFERKLQAGKTLADILKINAPPGFSEHHSGRALDIGTMDCAPADRAFENTPAFYWLLQHGADFYFELSYPENNPHGIVYEPWHWCYRP